MKPQIQLATNGSEDRKDKTEAYGREFVTDDGRRITVAKGAIMFVRDLGGDESQLGLRNSRPVIVLAPYSEMVNWWQTPPAKYKPKEARNARP